MCAETRLLIISIMVAMHKCVIPAELFFVDVSKRRKSQWLFNAIITYMDQVLVLSNPKPDHFAGTVFKNETDE